eukprot:1009893_1
MWFIAISCGFSYYFNSTYFRFCSITQQISISFYRTEHASISWDWIVLILWVAYFSVLGRLIVKLQNTMTKQNVYVNYSHDRAQSTISDSTIPHKLLMVATAALWSSFFLLCNGFVVLSVICDNLPDHNRFNMNR